MSAIRWVRLARETESMSPKPQGGDRRSARIEGHAPLILVVVGLSRTSRSPSCGRSWRRRASPPPCRRSGASPTGATSRSRKSAHAQEQDRPDVLRRWEAWFESQLDLDPERLVLIDETGASTKMARLHGRAPRGRPLRMGLPHGHWKTTTFVGALRLGDMTAPFGARRPHDRGLVPGLRRAGARPHAETRRRRRAGQPGRPSGRRRLGSG
jgi:hypothetical protein